ncbi:MAG: PIN-like domain-containing protein, partial [Xanthobacteraceae bacterium]
MRKSRVYGISDFVSDLCKRLEENKSKSPSAEEAKHIFFKISELVGDAVGDRPTQDKIDELIKQGEKRYETSVPPGYLDAKSKKGVDKYGDYLIWHEILEKAKATEKPVILVTDDVKEDWWHEFRGAKLGPRPELIEEMISNANQKFYMYRLSQFLDYASSFLNKQIDKTTIDEVK